MRVHELRVRNIRGIRSLDLSPSGKTFVLSGENGTGKSAVVDAIDFLMSGEIARLTGRRGISTRQHGSHIDSRPNESYVEADIEVPGHVGRVTVRRKMVTPEVLECPAPARGAVERCFTVAARRQHILTRLEILRFVSSAPRERSEIIQNLLNLGRLEAIRRELVTAANIARQTFERAHGEVVRSEGAMAQRLGLPNYDAARCLAAVNERRTMLSASPIESLTELRGGVAPIGAVAGPSAWTAECDGLLIQWSEGAIAGLDAAERQLRNQLEAVRADAMQVQVLRQAELVRTGLSLLGGGVACPLCDVPWQPGELREHLEKKLTQAAEATRRMNEIRRSADTVQRWIGDQPRRLRAVLGVQPPIVANPTALQDFLAQIERLAAQLENPLDRWVPPAGASLSASLNVAIVRELVATMRASAAGSGPDPRHAAWDALTRAEEHRTGLEGLRHSEENARVLSERASALREAFIASRWLIRSPCTVRVIRTAWGCVCVSHCRNVYLPVWGSGCLMMSSCRWTLATDGESPNCWPT